MNKEQLKAYHAKKRYQNFLRSNEQREIMAQRGAEKNRKIMIGTLKGKNDWAGHEQRMSRLHDFKGQHRLRRDISANDKRYLRKMVKGEVVHTPKVEF